MKTNNVDEYIACFPVDVRVKLQALRAAIKKTAPTAEETIGYMMPAYKLHAGIFCRL